MKLKVELHRVLLDLANTQRALNVERDTVMVEEKEYEAAQAAHQRLLKAAGSAQMAVDDMEMEILRIQADERKLRLRERDDKAQLEAELDPEKRRDLEHDRYAAKSRIADLMSELAEAHNEIHALRNNLEVHGARVSESERNLEKLRRAAEAARDARTNEEDPQIIIGRLRQQLPGDVLEEYDRIRLENGVGAAAFTNRVCGGCHIELPPAAVGAVRTAPADQLPECPDCGCLLIR